MKLGLVAYSDGNGHPFSFSAIINGYNREYFHLNPITPINDYLVNQPDHLFGIGEFEVTHVWSQSRQISNAIAKYSNIPFVVDSYSDMLDEVDGLLILRDDKHYETASAFLQKGKYVFIDKPLTSDTRELEFFIPYLENGQLMSCSGLRYFPKIVELSESEIDYSKELKFGYCTTINNWFSYGIHSIEGLSLITGSDYDYVQYLGNGNDSLYIIMFESGTYLLINTANDFSGGIRSHLYFYKHQPLQVHYNDNFNAFRNTLLKFNEQVTLGKPVIPAKDTIKLMQVLIAGEESKRLNGKKIFLNE